jgi:hypothetical protein
MSSGIIQTIQKAAGEAVEAGKPVNVIYGTVMADNPLEIRITPELTVREADGQIKKARQVTDYETEITVHDWYTENQSGGSGEAAFESHNHLITGRKKVTIHNSLKVGDIAIVLRKQGGQEYVVIDKVGE